MRALRTLLLACLCNAVLLSGAPRLLVLNKGNQTLAIVDAATLQVKSHVPSGPDPHEVEASVDGRLAYISNYTQGNGAANTLSVVDIANSKALPPVDLGALSRPHGLAMFGEWLYFTAEGSKVVGRYNPNTRKIDWVVGTGQDSTHMVLVSKDGKQIFTSNIGSGSVCLLEGAKITTIPVGRGAEGFDLSPDGKELWTANAQDATVSIIDVPAKKVVQTIQVPFRRANRLKFTPDGKHVLISDLNGNDLFVLDASKRSQETKIDLGGHAAGILIDPSGERAFVSVGSRNSVAVIDLKTWKLTNRIETGPNPDGLAWTN